MALKSEKSDGACPIIQNVPFGSKRSWPFCAQTPIDAPVISETATNAINGLRMITLLTGSTTMSLNDLLDRRLLPLVHRKTGRRRAPEQFLQCNRFLSRGCPASELTITA